MTKKYKLKDSVLVAGEIITDKVKELLGISDDKVEEIKQKNIWTPDGMFCGDVSNGDIEQIDVEKIWRIDDTTGKPYGSYHNKYYKGIFFKKEEDAQRYANRQNAFLNIWRWKIENDLPKNECLYHMHPTYIGLYYIYPLYNRYEGKYILDYYAGKPIMYLPTYSSIGIAKKAMIECKQDYELYFGII